MSLEYAEKCLRRHINEHGKVVAIVQLTEYDLERKEPAHGAVEFHSPLFFDLKDFWAGGAAATGSVRVNPETRKKTKMERGRAFHARVFVRLLAAPVEQCFGLSNQVELFPHNITVLQLRVEGSITNNDSVELLLDDEGCVAGVKYIMSPEKHQVVVDNLIAQTVGEQLLNRFQNVASAVDQKERVVF